MSEYLSCSHHKRNIERVFNMAVNEACYHAQVSLGSGVIFKNLEPLLSRADEIANNYAVNSKSFLLNECIDAYKEGWACVEALTDKKISRPTIFLFPITWKALTRLAIGHYSFLCSL